MVKEIKPFDFECHVPPTYNTAKYVFFLIFVAIPIAVFVCIAIKIFFLILYKLSGVFKGIA